MNRTDLLLADLKAKRLVREALLKHQSQFSPPPPPQPVQPKQGQENVTQPNIQQQQPQNPIPPNQPV